MAREGRGRRASACQWPPHGNLEEQFEAGPLPGAFGTLTDPVLAVLEPNPPLVKEMTYEQLEKAGPDGWAGPVGSPDNSARMNAPTSPPRVSALLIRVTARGRVRRRIRKKLSAR